MAIQAYRLVLSPWVGYRCRFSPTCSAYALAALSQHGLLKGVWLSIKRICRCHPWSEGGIDDPEASCSLKQKGLKLVIVKRKVSKRERVKG